MLAVRSRGKLSGPFPKHRGGWHALPSGERIVPSVSKATRLFPRVPGAEPSELLAASTHSVWKEAGWGSDLSPSRHSEWDLDKSLDLFSHLREGHLVNL